MNTPTTKFPQYPQDASNASSGSRGVEGLSGFRRTSRHVLTGIGIAVSLLGSGLAVAQTAPNLGTAASFAVLGTNPIATSGTVTCTGSTINGNVGSTFNSITSTGCTLNGTITAPVGAAVVADFNNAYNGITDITQPCTGTIPTVSTTLAPGVYCSAAATTIGTGVTLTLNGNGSDVWVFRVGTGGLGALTMTGTQVVMGGTAQACNVYWKTAEGASITDANFLGTVLAGTAFTMVRGSMSGRAFARTDATVTDAAPLSFAACAAPPTIAVTKVSNGGVGSFNFTGTNGFVPQSIVTVTSGTGVTGAAQALAAAGVITTITESAPPAGFVLTGVSCSGLGAGGSATPNLPARSVTLDVAATATGSSIACTFTNTSAALLPTMRVTKVSSGGIGSFSFTGTNGFAPQTIATVTSGTGVTGAAQTLTAAGAITTITESAPPAGFVLTAVACSGLGAGGTATPNLPARTVTLDAAATAAGSAIACTFTNTLAALLPTIRVTKVSNGGVNSFGFTGTNGFAPQTITTVTPGVGVAGATQTLTAPAVSTTITESAPPAGYSLVAIACSGLGAGGTATPNIASRSVTLDAAATAAGAAIACTFTNSLPQTATGIPTLSEWAMLLLAGLMAIAGFAALRGRKQL